MSSKVTFIRVHQDLFATGWGPIGNRLPASGKSFPGLSMVSTPAGVEVSAEGKKYAKFLVPWGNIVVAELLQEEAKPLLNVTPKASPTPKVTPKAAEPSKETKAV